MLERQGEGKHDKGKMFFWEIHGRSSAEGKSIHLKETNWTDSLSPFGEKGRGPD